MVYRTRMSKPENVELTNTRMPRRALPRLRLLAALLDCENPLALETALDEALERRGQPVTPADSLDIGGQSPVTSRQE